MINKLAKEVHANAKDKGFHEGEKNIGEMLMLIVTEVSEACEADRKKSYFSDLEIRPEWVNDLEDDEKFKSEFAEIMKDTFEDELADIMIRVMDLAEMKGINLEEHIIAKMRYNKTREYKHGKEY